MAMGWPIVEGPIGWLSVEGPVADGAEESMSVCRMWDVCGTLSTRVDQRSEVAGSDCMRKGENRML